MLFSNPVNNTSRILKTLSVLALTVSLAACGGQQPEGGENAEGTNGDATNTTASGSKLDLGGKVILNGTGATFPEPLYQTWFQKLNKKYPNLQVNYLGEGSGAGVNKFTKIEVDFGASDVAMKDDEIAKIPEEKGVLLLPMTAGSVVLAYNLPGVDKINLSREVYTEIFLNKITEWNDAKIAKDNPGVNLPDKKITVVHRSDGSGTTGVFTKHLSAISPDWEKEVGEGKTVEWPTGTAGKGNPGVTSLIQQIEGSIGYIEYSYAKERKLPVAALQNKDGAFVVPTDESASKTLSAVELPENLRAFIKDPKGKESYPIVTYSWILAYKKYDDPAKAKAIEVMIEYGLTEGQKVSKQLGYIPLPENVVQKVAAAADAISPEYKIAVGASQASK